MRTCLVALLAISAAIPAHAGQTTSPECINSSTQVYDTTPGSELSTELLLHGKLLPNGTWGHNHTPIYQLTIDRLAAGDIIHVDAQFELRSLEPYTVMAASAITVSANPDDYVVPDVAKPAYYAGDNWALANRKYALRNPSGNIVVTDAMLDGGDELTITVVAYAGSTARKPGDTIDIMFRTAAEAAAGKAPYGGLSALVMRCSETYQAG